MSEKSVGRNGKEYVGAYVSKSTKAALRKKAADMDVTVSVLVRLIIKKYINKETA